MHSSSSPHSSSPHSSSSPISQQSVSAGIESTVTDSIGTDSIGTDSIGTDSICVTPADSSQTAVPSNTGDGQEPSPVGAIPPIPPQPIEAWLDTLQHHSGLPLALVSVQTLGVEFANDAFREILGLTAGNAIAAPAAGLQLLNLFQPGDQIRLRSLFRRHMLARILAHYYQTPDLVDDHLLSEPILIEGPSFHQTETQRIIELRLSSDRVQILNLTQDLESDLDQCFAQAPTSATVMAQLLDSTSALRSIQQHLERDRYQADGLVLIEGADVTEREALQSLMELLLSPESVLQPQKFNRANQLMQGLFRADDSLILNAENDRTTLFLELDQPDWRPYPFPSDQIETSIFCQAATSGQVLNVPDLTQISRTPLEQLLYDQGRRSLLLIPLVVKANVLAIDPADQDAHPASHQSPNQALCTLLGMVGLASDRPYAFHPQDYHHAKTLVPALAAAMRHTMRDRFTNIHPSVRWRFEQEAERRSWGLPPTPIVFNNVYPLYGISDIRGSSHERNRAIQTDLLTQFQLALGILEALETIQPTAYIQQLKLDLLEQQTHLETDITVDAEVTFVRYLQNHLEIHFDTFCRWGETVTNATVTNATVTNAVNAYQDACNNSHGCVYQARTTYDDTVHQINTRLRETWAHWQTAMQAITPHYCDVECSDGIDHMIYVGQAINPDFSPFQLNSLRYEQLRAVCDCARVCLRLRQQLGTAMDVTHLVLVQDATVEITHDEDTERLFDVRGTRDTRYEIVKKRIDKAVDVQQRQRITQPGMLTIVYSTPTEWDAYRQYLHYLHREGWVAQGIEQGAVEPLQGVHGLKFARVRVLPDPETSLPSANQSD